MIYLALPLLCFAFLALGVALGGFERRESRRAVRLLTRESRDEGYRFARAVGPSVRTPLPFRPLKTKGVA